LGEKSVTTASTYVCSNYVTIIMKVSVEQPDMNRSTEKLFTKQEERRLLTSDSNNLVTGAAMVLQFATQMSAAEIINKCGLKERPGSAVTSKLSQMRQREQVLNPATTPIRTLKTHPPPKEAHDAVLRSCIIFIATGTISVAPTRTLTDVPRSWPSGALTGTLIETPSRTPSVASKRRPSAAQLIARAIDQPGGREPHRVKG
jgi:hypothetical protein